MELLQIKFNGKIWIKWQILPFPFIFSVFIFKNSFLDPDLQLWLAVPLPLSPPPGNLGGRGNYPLPPPAHSSANSYPILEHTRCFVWQPSGIRSYCSGSGKSGLWILDPKHWNLQDGEERVAGETRRRLEEQQAEWERLLRTNRDQADQDKRTIINRSGVK